MTQFCDSVQLQSSHMCCECGAVLGVVGPLRGHDVVAPAAVDPAADAVPPQRGVAHHRPGVVLKELISSQCHSICESCTEARRFMRLQIRNVGLNVTKPYFHFNDEG